MRSAGIKFETFAERRVRGAMIDALRRDAWPRGVRRQRRELDAAREALRRELGHEPSMADLAARVGSDEKRLSRTIVRINTIEATSPLATGEHLDESSLPTALVPSEPDSPDTAYEKTETRDRVRAAIQSLPWRERKVIGLYYYGEVTMKQIGAEIGVNESRVSQLHARAIRRLRDALGDMNPQKVAEMRRQLIAFAVEEARSSTLKWPPSRSPLFTPETVAKPHAVVIPYKKTAARTQAKAHLRTPVVRAFASVGCGARRSPQREIAERSSRQDFAHGSQQVGEPERLRQPADTRSPRGTFRRPSRRRHR